MVITNNGRVTIPAEIRNRLGWSPNTPVDFEIDGDSVRIRRAESAIDRRGHRLIQHLAGQRTLAMSTDEILRLTRGDETP